MEKLSLLNLVNKYVDDENKRMNNRLSKSARNSWIEGDVKDELTAINDEYSLIIKSNDADARVIFEDRIKAQFKTNYFQDFLLNKSKPTQKYYKNLLDGCIINPETIDDFFKPKGKSNPKTLDFFMAFCKNQEREYGKETGNKTIKEHIKQPIDYANTEKIEIPGATIIDEALINLYKGQKENAVDFYIGKQIMNCQWSGVINCLDIPRKIYPQFKEVVEKSFDIQIKNKIFAVVSGNAGSGKSTILRRLCIDLASSPLTILWLNVEQIKLFIKKGFDIIKKNEQDNFLLVVEDWDQFFSNRGDKEIDFLQIASSIANVRIVLGDRYIEGKKYTDHLHNRYNIFKLGKDENEKIAYEVGKKIFKWDSEEQLITRRFPYPSSLYSILFVMMRFELLKTEDNLFEATNTFYNIVKRDIEFIALYYPGLAKALYYWANIYQTYKAAISYQSFLKLADYYQGTNEISRYFIEMDITDNEVINILKTYIFIIPDVDRLHFHHLLLTEAISKACLQGWEKYSSISDLIVLDVLIDNNDELFLSNLYSQIIIKKQRRLNRLNREDKAKYNDIKSRIENYLVMLANRMLSKGKNYNFFWHYIQGFPLNDEVYTSFSKKIWDLKNFSPNFWCKFLNGCQNEELREDYISRFLDVEKIQTTHPQILGLCIKYAKNDELRENFICSFLKIHQWEHMGDFFIEMVLDYSSNKTLKKKIIGKIMYFTENKNFGYRLVRKAFFSSSLSSRRYYSDAVLSSPDWELRDSELVEMCIVQCNKKDIIQHLITQIQLQKNLTTISKNVLISILVVSRSTSFSKFLLKNWENGVSDSVIKYILEELTNINDKENFYRKVLLTCKRNRHYINDYALKHTSDQNLRQRFLEKFFSSKPASIFFEKWDAEFLKYNKDSKFIEFLIEKVKTSSSFFYTNEVLIYLLENSNDEALSLFILSNRKKFDDKVIELCLSIYAGQNQIPIIVSDFIEKCISEKNTIKKIISSQSYVIVMGLDFSSVESWKKENIKLIDCYETIRNEIGGVQIISSILSGNKNHPKNITHICSKIMDDWLYFINYSFRSRMIFYQEKGESNKNPIIQALGHPDLRHKANITALQIFYSQQYKKGEPYESFANCIKKIIFEGIFPVWD